MKILKTSSFIATCVVAFCLLLTSCNKEKSPVEFKDDDVPYDEAETNRTYLENTATTFLSYIDPVDQSIALVALNTFKQLCETYTFPSNFSFDDVNSMKDATQALSDAIDGGDFTAMSRAATGLLLNLSRFQGLYQANPNTHEWQYLEQRDHVFFRYWIDKTEYSLTVNGVGGAWSLGIENGEDYIQAEIPKDLSLNLFTGSSSPYNFLITVKLISDGKDKDHLNLSADVKFANLILSSTTKATNNSITENYLLSADNTSTLYRTKLMSSVIEIKGSNLCSSVKWKQFGKSSEPMKVLEDMVSSVTATTMIVQRVQLKTQVSDAVTFLQNVGQTWTPDTHGDPQARAKAAAAALSKVVTTNMYYPGENDKIRGSLGWEAYIPYDDPTYQSWSVRPVLVFTADNASYDFESYFGNNKFLSVERSFDNIMTDFYRYWK